MGWCVKVGLVVGWCVKVGLVVGWCEFSAGIVYKYIYCVQLLYH